MLGLALLEHAQLLLLYRSVKTGIEYVLIYYYCFGLFFLSELSAHKIVNFIPNTVDGNKLVTFGSPMYM